MQALLILLVGRSVNNSFFVPKHNCTELITDLCYVFLLYLKLPQNL
jgi:hypothetical protein